MDAHIWQRSGGVTPGRSVVIALAILVSALAALAPAGVAGASTNGSIVFVKDRDIWLTGPDGVNRTRLTTNGGSSTPDNTGNQRYGVPSQSDAGDVIVAVRNQTVSTGFTEGYLWVLNRQGQLIRKFKPAQPEFTMGGPCQSQLQVIPRGLNDAEISPDGTKVAYEALLDFQSSTCATGATSQVWVSNIDGSNPVLITRASDGSWAGLAGPSWTSNSQIVLASRSSSTDSLYSVDLPSASAVLWAGPSGDNDPQEPVLRAGKLATVGFAPGSEALFLWSTPGPPTQPVPRCVYTNAVGGIFGRFGAPAWAPDGSALIWKEGDSAPFDANEGIYIMDVGDIAGGCPPASSRRLLVQGGLEADWGPAGIGPSGLGGGRYTALAPARILDTRDGTGGIGAPIGPGASVDVQVTGKGGVPATGVSAVAMNVTVTSPTATGFLTLSPAGVPRPLAANLNFTPGKTVPNLVVVKVGAGGKVALFNSAGSSDVIFDVAGWYGEVPAGNDGRFQPLTPARILDTRTGAGGGVRLGPGASLDVQVAGQGGVPVAGAGAAVLNVAVTGTTDVSFLTVFPTGAPRPLAANLNFVGGDTVSNRVMAKLGTGGKLTIYNNAGSTDVVVDVNGWYTDASVAGTSGTYAPLVPARILDTRDGTGGISGPRPASSIVDVQVTGQGGVPSSGVSAVIVNVTVTQPAAGGFLTISPAGAARPLASDLNYAGGETRPNLVVVKLGTGGKVSLFTSAGTHVVFDVAGWMS